MIDLLVLGGGPAGTATAITAAHAGLQVVMLERTDFSRFRPGETLHPGTEPLLKQLGAAEAVLGTGVLRHQGIRVRWGGSPRVDRYGTDAEGPWCGLQVPRTVLDAALVDAARRSGGDIRPNVSPWQVIVESGRVAGVRAGAEEWRARWTVDATGGGHRLARQLAIPVIRHSPRLIARYGYVKGHCPDLDAVPSIWTDSTGWTWVARIAANSYQWTRVKCVGESCRGTTPGVLASLEPIGPTRGADVSWRIAASPSGPGYFIAGDAACVLDPSSSNGVLRALMTGIMVGHLASAVGQKLIDEPAAATRYAAWLIRWFAHDCARLRERWLWCSPQHRANEATSARSAGIGRSFEEDATACR